MNRMTDAAIAIDSTCFFKVGDRVIAQTPYGPMTTTVIERGFVQRGPNDIGAAFYIVRDNRYDGHALYNENELDRLPSPAKERNVNRK